MAECASADAENRENLFANHYFALRFELTVTPARIRSTETKMWNVKQETIDELDQEAIRGSL